MIMMVMMMTMFDSCIMTKTAGGADALPIAPELAIHDASLQEYRKANPLDGDHRS
jgi:hypothetical protein